MTDKKETILFAVPEDGEKIGFHMEKNMKDYGFQVVNLGFPINQFKYRNLSQKLSSFYQKKIRGNKDHKRILRFNQYKKELENKLNNLTEKADYALIIGADNYSKEFLELVKSKSKKMYGYLWDGLDVYPVNKKMIPLFDAFYVFDPKDLAYQNEFPNIKPASNFYFENLAQPNKTKEIDLYYLGGMEKNRISLLKKINKVTKGLKKEIYLITNKNGAITDGEIQTSSKHFTYLENLEKVQQSKTVLDLLNPHHNGLSFRTFEAMSNNCKLITTNETIKDYEFYEEENIFIWDETNSEKIKNFVLKPAFWDNEKIKKYAFKNWLNYVLQRENFEEISLLEN